MILIQQRTLPAVVCAARWSTSREILSWLYSNSI